MGGSSLGFVTMVCGFENGRNDAGIAGTATEMTAEHLDHFSFGRIGIALKEIRERHENAGSAESALQRMVVLEGLLQHAELAISAGQRFHRRHRPALGLDCEGQARPHRRPIEEHRAAPAYAMLASDMGSGRAEHVPEKIAQQHARLGLARHLAAVEREAEPGALALVHPPHRLASSMTAGAMPRSRSRRMRAEACTSS